MTDPRLHMRASSLPRLWECPTSVLVPPIELRTRDDYAAREGTAAHVVEAKLVETGEPDYDAVDAVAAKHGVDPKGVRILLAQAATLWREIQHAYPAPSTEVELRAEHPDIVLTGHVDVLSVVGPAAHVLDWKDGRKDSNYEQQMRGYAYLVLATYPSAESVISTVGWVRDCEIERYTTDRWRALEWMRELRSRVLDTVPHPGEHCVWCPRAHECDVGARWERRARAIVKHVPTDLSALDPADLLRLHEAASTVRILSGRALDAIRDHIRQHGPVSDGKQELRLTVEERHQIDPVAGWEVLDSFGFDDEDKAAIMTMSLSKARDIVAGRAARGAKKLAINQLEIALEQADAIQTTTYEKIKKVRTG